MSNFTIRHLDEERRYALYDTEAAGGTGETEIGQEAYVDVAADNRTQRVMYHTLVSEDYGGQGLASRLVQFAVDDTIAAGHQIVPVCPYVVKWLEKNSQYDEHVVKAQPQHLSAIRDTLASRNTRNASKHFEASRSARNTPRTCARQSYDEVRRQP